MSLGHGPLTVKQDRHLLLDWSNSKCYNPAVSTVNLNNLAQNENRFQMYNSATVENGYMRISGVNNGPRMSEVASTGGSTGIGNHGTGSFTYQLLVRPFTSTSTDSPTEARLYEQSGWPDTYFILRVANNSGNPTFQFFLRDVNVIGASISSPGGSAVMEQWIFLTTIVNKADNLIELYLNDHRYTADMSSVTGDIGNDDLIGFPHSYAEPQADYSVILGYRKALTRDEVLQNFNAYRGRYGI